MRSSEFQFESVTSVVNVGLALVVLLLGIRIIRVMPFSLLRNSVQLFVAASILFAGKEWFSTVTYGSSTVWIADVPQAMETIFIACLCGAMYLLVQSEKLEISSLRDRAEKDPLTGLMNLSEFSKVARLRFKYARDNGTPLIVMMIDLDSFKHYNDSFGHEAGNVALKAAATTLHRTARESDLVARYGGEEFILLLPVHEDAAFLAAERIRKVIETECSPLRNPHIFRDMTASIGVARLIDSTKSFQDLIEVADRELYAAKAGGRNRVSIALEG